MRRPLRQVPRTRHTARQGTQSADAKEVEGHLRDHTGQGALSHLVEAQHSEQAGVRRSISRDGAAVIVCGHLADAGPCALLLLALHLQRCRMMVSPMSAQIASMLNLLVQSTAWRHECNGVPGDAFNSGA